MKSCTNALLYSTCIWFLTVYENKEWKLRVFPDFFSLISNFIITKLDFCNITSVTLLFHFEAMFLCVWLFLWGSVSDSDKSNLLFSFPVTFQVPLICTFIYPMVWLVFFCDLVLFSRAALKLIFRSLSMPFSFFWHLLMKLLWWKHSPLWPSL